MLNYALILLVVVLLFISFKNKEGLAAGEASLNPTSQPILEVIALNIDNQPPQYKSFAATIQQQCAYYDSGNAINTAINDFSKDTVFTSKVNKCYDDFKSTPAALNSCYAGQLKAYKPSNGYDASRVIKPCIQSLVTTNNVTNFAPPPKLSNPSMVDAIPININKLITDKNYQPKKGWDGVGFQMTQTCSPFNSLTEIDSAFESGKNMAMSKLSNGSIGPNGIVRGGDGCVDVMLTRSNL